MPHSDSDNSPTSVWTLLLAGLMAAIAYWITFSKTQTAAAILLALPCLFVLCRAGSPRKAFYLGLFTGVAMYAPPLAFFFRVFGPSAIALYLIAGLPIAIFALLGHLARKKLAPRYAMLLLPVLWTGIEYFRSELYQLRFAWLLPGQAVAFVPGARLLCIGVYGLGFVLAVLAMLIVQSDRRCRWFGIAGSVCLAIAMYWPALPVVGSTQSLQVAGVQYEFPTAAQAAGLLDHLAVANPNAQLLVLSEYSFAGPVPDEVRDVIRKHHRYLIAGGMRSSDANFYDTAFVIGPDGKDLFEQAKSVPVQFMQDGLPARRRRVWDSPWGKIGIAICYDLSYANVMDDFVRQGARAMIIPTEDGMAWGRYEREMLHGRMAPVRSAEYGIPTFGVWSSGQSQLTDRTGKVIATAGYPGQGVEIAGELDLSKPGRVPPDREFAFFCAIFTGVFAMVLAVAKIRQNRSRN